MTMGGPLSHQEVQLLLELLERTPYNDMREAQIGVALKLRLTRIYEETLPVPLEDSEDNGTNIPSSN